MDISIFCNIVYATKICRHTINIFIWLKATNCALLSHTGARNAMAVNEAEHPYSVCVLNHLFKKSKQIPKILFYLSYEQDKDDDSYDTCGVVWWWYGHQMSKSDRNPCMEWHLKNDLYLNISWKEFLHGRTYELNAQHTLHRTKV